ncbi:MAG: sulfite exporter TauE/SafE family protein [Hoeflea sp.]|uniref:sulfite exporter TauE/SafE family protein n=1 Tax=Hoeflea sp. TaxID=1940281 RepID=UPI001DD9D2A9|nr:sulfite exporter TauE/SafE family protein [Hoeflea sp.]MBU4531703.1 sulfite exporter TauE/SafE family protein [Alphaproteobacteria bacterium]MBU4544559.1 sulfite exporter TauE/SafE family protein [Alphaproteobacteria bacterium]MBU4552790.1 sulfite exporter TauE/SafE family protein [Alphaproteobacteria bacterium]MBV1724979.1 sulfite exporter TauE/SafE family protein [Hoeflea sp.]MBV1760999.1 sulfite exporter TauE/SafE family protein [Hoeflea sp.]
MIASLVPSGVEPWAAVVLIIVSFFTSALTVSVGIGGGVAMLALMGYLVPVAAIIPVHGVVQLGSNVGRAAILRNHVAWACLAAFLIGAIPGAWAGGLAVGALAEPVLKAALGGFILFITWMKFPRLAAIRLPGFALTGAVTTFLTMIFGATGPFNAVVLSKTFPERLRFQATTAAVMSLQHLVKTLAFALAGFAFAPWLPLIAVMIVTGLAGTWVGAHILRRTPESRFQLIFKICLTVLALDLVRRGVAGMAQA